MAKVKKINKRDFLIVRELTSTGSVCEDYGWGLKWPLDLIGVISLEKCVISPIHLWAAQSWRFVCSCNRSDLWLEGEERAAETGDNISYICVGYV